MRSCRALPHVDRQVRRHVVVRESRAFGVGTPSVSAAWAHSSVSRVIVPLADSFRSVTDEMTVLGHLVHRQLVLLLSARAARYV